MGEVRWAGYKPEDINHHARRMVEIYSEPKVPVVLRIPATKSRLEWFVAGMIVATALLMVFLY